MFNSIEKYLSALKDEMRDADTALLQDALADAHEHLSTALEAARLKNPDVNLHEALQTIVDEYGSPEETALAYKEIERRTSPHIKPALKPRSPLGRFFGVYVDPRAWGGLLFMLISFITGIFYFTWAVTGISLSIPFMLFIFGLPFVLFFLLSIRGLAVLEGRLVEALLGIRMPRRPHFLQPGMKWLERLKALLTDKATWLMLAYMLLQLVFGVVYFFVVITVLIFSITITAYPLIQEFSEVGIYMDGAQYFAPAWTYPLWLLGGILLWTGFMHIVRGISQLHGKLAKWMLV